MTDQGYSLRLPSGWSKGASSASGADTYRADDGSGQITVTTLLAKEPMDDLTRDETLTRLLVHRQNAERAVMGPRMTASEPVKAKHGHGASVQYDGVDAEAALRFGTLVTVTSSGAWVVYFESRERDADTFRRSEQAIFDGLDVRK